jgi:2-dehydro-3-deoxyphosphogluconate aldolase / (4S)-4-hydroxy-2-oxoglutarate aldolase
LAKVNFPLSATNGVPQERAMDDMENLLRTAPVIPVLVLDDPDHAVEVGTALVAGGLPVLEVTLRTPRALEAIAAMTSIPGAIVGAGTASSSAPA